MRWAIPSGGAIAALAAILALAPAASAAAPTHAVVISAPYHGILSSSSSSLYIAGCGGASLVPAFFHFNTGLSGLLTKASGPTCQSRGGSSGGSSTGVGVNVNVPIHKSKATVVVLAKLTAFVDSHLVAGTCTTMSGSNYSDCYQSAFASFYAFTYLIDTTTGAYYLSSNYFPGAYSDVYSYLFCYEGNCTTYSSNTSTPTHLSTTFGWWFNLTGLNPSDHFQVNFGISGYAGASAAAYGATLKGGNTWAVVNADTFGNGVDLASITVT